MVHQRIASHWKVRQLARVREGRWCFVAGILAIASASPERGRLLMANGRPATLDDIAEWAEVRRDIARKAIAFAIETELIHDDDGTLSVRDWDEYQTPPRSDPTAAERQKRHRRRRDRNVTGNAGHTGEVEGEVEVEASKEPSTTSEKIERADVARLCRLLADEVAKDGTKRPDPDTKRWHDACRLLLDRDGATAEQVSYVIGWTQRHEFWSGNVLSMPKLREKWSQLTKQIRNEQKKQQRARLPEREREKIKRTARTLGRDEEEMVQAEEERLGARRMG
jgi:hypothetical protein